MTFFMISWFNLEYIWELVKIAIIAVFHKITFKIWILMHDMNPAILLFSFFIYILKPSNIDNLNMYQREYFLELTMACFFVLFCSVDSNFKTAESPGFKRFFRKAKSW